VASSSSSSSEAMVAEARLLLEKACKDWAAIDGDRHGA
jgi:hypothetical protein